LLPVKTYEIFMLCCETLYKPNQMPALLGCKTAIFINLDLSKPVLPPR
jgi:hypothetical protein